MLGGAGFLPSTVSCVVKIRMIETKNNKDNNKMNNNKYSNDSAEYIFSVNMRVVQIKTIYLEPKMTSIFEGPLKTYPFSTKNKGRLGSRYICNIDLYTYIHIYIYTYIRIYAYNIYIYVCSPFFRLCIFFLAKKMLYVYTHTIAPRDVLRQRPEAVFI